MAKSMFRTELFGGNAGPNALPLMRISYAQGLWKARAAEEGGKEKHSVTLIVPKTDVAKLVEKVKECVEGEWGERGLQRLKDGLIKSPILPGDGPQAKNRQTGELKAGMGPDVMFIRPQANKEYPPKVFGPDSLPMDPKDIKSGWWGYPVLNVFAWHNSQNGDGVSFGLNMWMHAKEDEVLGGDGGGNPTDFFAAVQAGADEGGSSGNSGGGAADMFG